MRRRTMSQRGKKLESQRGKKLEKIISLKSSMLKDIDKMSNDEMRELKTLFSEGPKKQVDFSTVLRKNMKKGEKKKISPPSTSTMFEFRNDFMKNVQKQKKNKKTIRKNALDKKKRKEMEKQRKKTQRNKLDKQANANRKTRKRMKEIEKEERKKEQARQARLLHRPLKERVEKGYSVPSYTEYHDPATGSDLSFMVDLLDPEAKKRFERTAFQSKYKISKKNLAAIPGRKRFLKSMKAANKKKFKKDLEELFGVDDTDNTAKSKQQSKKKSKQNLSLQKNLSLFFGDLPGDNNNNLPSAPLSKSNTWTRGTHKSKLELVSGKQKGEQRATGQNQDQMLSNQHDQNDALNEMGQALNRMEDVIGAIKDDTTDIKGNQKETHTYLRSIQGVSTSISRGVKEVNKRVREGFAHLNQEVGNCMQLQYLRKNFGWCLIYLLQWLVAMVGWFHVKYTQIVKNITIGIGSIVGEVPYVGVILKWMVYFFGLVIYIFFGILVWSFILSRVFGPQFAFNMLINMFERAFDSMVVFLYEMIWKLIDHIKNVEYLDGARRIANKMAGIIIRLPLNTVYCLFMYGVCQSNPFKRSGQCEKELGECIMTAINNIKNSAEEGQSGGNKDINMKELDSMIKKIRKKFKEKYGEQMYTDITKYAHASVNELIQPLKKNETYLDRIADIGSTVTGNIFSTILKNPSNKKANTEKMQKSFKTAIDLFDNMKTHIDNIADNFPKIKKEDYKIIKKYDDKKMKEIITLAKKEGLVLENKLPKVKKIIQNITICALNPKLQLNLIAFLLTYTGDINTIQSLMKRPKKSSLNVLKTLPRSIMARRSKKKRIKNPKTKKQKKGKGKNKSKKQKSKRKKSQKR